MKKLILVFLLFCSLTGVAQTRYVLYTDSAGYNHVSSTPLPLIAIWGFRGTSAQYTKGDGTYGTLPTATPYTVLAKSASYTVSFSDFGSSTVLKIPVTATSGAVVITITTTTVPSGYTVIVSKTDASTNAVTISGVTSDNIMTVQNSSKEVLSDGSTLSQN